LTQILSALRDETDYAKIIATIQNSHDGFRFPEEGDDLQIVDLRFLRLADKAISQLV
jgi:hypothetical protein